MGLVERGGGKESERGEVGLAHGPALSASVGEGAAACGVGRAWRNAALTCGTSLSAAKGDARAGFRRS